MNNKIYFIVIIFYFTGHTLAQEDFETWQKKELNRFEKFISNDDKQFIDFIKKSWQGFELKKALIKDNKPGPKVIPQINTDELKNNNELIQKKNADISVIKTDKIVVEIQSDQEMRKITDTENNDISKETKNSPDRIIIDFYGTKEDFPAIHQIEMENQRKVDAGVIADFWEKLILNSPDSIINLLKIECKNNSLNDWGYFITVNKYSKGIYPGNKNYQLLLTWGILVRSGYKVKAAIINDEVLLLVPSKQNIYFTSFITLKDDEKYYMINFEKEGNVREGKIFTYENDYKNADKYLDLNIYRELVLNSTEKDRELKFLYNDSTYIFKAKTNNSLINFYKEYPQSDYEIYFNAETDRMIKNSLTEQLKVTLQGKSDWEKVNFLLHFCQKAFDYKTDADNFGYEKTLFVSETIYYPYSDCEDRSVLFAYLVRELVGLRVVGLNYTDHIATAVRFNEKNEGYKVNYKGDEYVVCDPTYINANVGVCMPDYKDQKYKIIAMRPL